MKVIVYLIFTCGLGQLCFAQQQLNIATDKTTSLIFPFPILHVDRGTKEVLVQQVKEADNILLVKASSQNFSETNLSVITGDGSMYSFRVNYDSSPSKWIWNLPVQGRASIAMYANSLLDNPRTMHGIHDLKWDMCMRVDGIYIKDDVIYYQLFLSNRSPIDYDIDQLRFYIRDKKKGRRTAVQENVLNTLFIAGNTNKVKGNCKDVVVVAFEKFTIPDAKFLAIQMMEKNGGRHLMMKVGNEKIVKAKLLADLH